VEQTRALNQLLDQLWLYFNFFQPVLRLKDKTWDGRRVRRIHDKARTPFHRVLGKDALSADRVEEMCALRRRTNPRQLRRDLLVGLNDLFHLPLAEEGRSEDIYLTLLRHPTERRWASR